MSRVLVLDVVGLTPRILRSGDAPRLDTLPGGSGLRAALTPVLPAVTCSVQATFLTGLMPSGHGVVGNGWYFRDLAEVWLWRQSNRLVAGPRVWAPAEPTGAGASPAAATPCAKLFWWYNMHSTAAWSVTPRPVYPADGRKLPDIYTQPPELRDRLVQELGMFPLFRFWGPTADLASSEWIAAASTIVLREQRPELCLVYLPHLDYDLQRHGPDDPRSRQAVRDVDRVAGGLADEARGLGYEVVVLSEYGITAVSGPVHINRALRDAGLLRVHAPRGAEYLDPGASRAFAVADHQVAHVYVAAPADVPGVAALLRGLDGVAEVLDAQGKAARGLDHPRSGELVAVAAPDRWFTYYYWLDDRRAPDFARCVDIHRKPGYDPMELMLDPDRRAMKLRAMSKLAMKTLGFRTIFDVIGLDAQHVRGSHGRLPDDPDDGPVLLTTTPAQGPAGGPDAPVHASGVADLLRRLLAQRT